MKERKLQLGDQVSWKDGRKTLYGRILGISGGIATIDMEGDGYWGEECTVPLDRLQYEAPVTLEREALRRFARFEITYDDLK